MIGALGPGTTPLDKSCGQRAYDERLHTSGVISAHGVDAQHVLSGYHCTS